MPLLESVPILPQRPTVPEFAGLQLLDYHIMASNEEG